MNYDTINVPFVWECLQLELREAPGRLNSFTEAIGVIWICRETFHSVFNWLLAIPVFEIDENKVLITGERSVFLTIPFILIFTTNATLNLNQYTHKMVFSEHEVEWIAPSWNNKCTVHHLLVISMVIVIF